jgi:hypothetical protein
MVVEDWYAFIHSSISSNRLCHFLSVEKNYRSTHDEYPNYPITGGDGNENSELYLLRKMIG